MYFPDCHTIHSSRLVSPCPSAGCIALSESALCTEQLVVWVFRIVFVLRSCCQNTFETFDLPLKAFLSHRSMCSATGRYSIPCMPCNFALDFQHTTITLQSCMHIHCIYRGRTGSQQVRCASAMHRLMVAVDRIAFALPLRRSSAKHMGSN